jgi:hypothetical protein
LPIASRAVALAFSSVVRTRSSASSSGSSRAAWKTKGGRSKGGSSTPGIIWTRRRSSTVRDAPERDTATSAAHPVWTEKPSAADLLFEIPISGEPA